MGPNPCDWCLCQKRQWATWTQGQVCTEGRWHEDTHGARHVKAEDWGGAPPTADAAGH